MKKACRVFAIIFPMVLISSLILLLLWQRKKELPWEGFSPPDDIKVARQLLSNQFTGPRYFAFVEEPEPLDFPYISVSSADSQIGGILSARSLPSEVAETIRKLIDKLAIHPSSRLAGTDRINVLKLNLALDEMK